MEMALDYYQELKEITRFFKKTISEFPKNKCQYVSKIVSRIFNLEVRNGYYIIDDELVKSNEHINEKGLRKKGVILPHAWNYDKENNLYIDVTSRQFDTKNPEILILSEDTRRLFPSRTIETIANNICRELDNKVTVFLNENANTLNQILRSRNTPSIIINN
jgi:hypothetical protein